MKENDQVKKQIEEIKADNERMQQAIEMSGDQQKLHGL